MIPSEYVFAACLGLVPSIQEGDLNPRPFVILETREVRDLFAEAERHIEAARTLPALAALQRILDELPNHLAATPGSRTTFVGAGIAADERIASLSVEEKRAYEGAFGPKAAAMLRNARAWNDRAKIREVANRFGNTLAGVAARTTLGDLAFERGDLEGAGREYARAISRADGERRPHLLARLARTLALLGDVAGLADLARSAAEEGDRTAEVEGKPVPLGEALDRASADAAAVRKGRPSGLGISLGRELSTKPQWTFRLPMEPFAPPFHSRETWGYTPPNMVPTVADGIVLLSDSLRLYALDLLHGRTPAWSFAGAPEWESVAASGRDGLLDFFGGLRASTLVRPAAAAGVAVEALQVPLKRPSDRIETFQGIPIRTILPERRLFAFDLRSGASLWTHWSPTAAYLGLGPFETRATVAAPPLADVERVYAVSVLYEGKVDYYVAAYELRTGREIWRTRLIFGQIETNMFGRPFKEFSGSPPLLVDGSLFLSTNLGAVARIEAETGRVEWVSLYDPLPIQKPRFHQQDERVVHWGNGPPVLSGDLLFATPLDSDRLFVLDARRGSTLTVVPKRQVEDALGEIPLRHLVGTFEDRVILVGGLAAAFRCEREEDGRVRCTFAWRAPVADAEGLGPMPRPVLVGERLFLPAADGPVALDARTGKKLPGELYWDLRYEHRGNLVAADGALLSASIGSVNAFFDWESLLHAARARGSSPADAARLLLRRGESRIGEGNASAALGDLREADRLLSETGGAEDAPGVHFQVLVSLAEAERRNHAPAGAVAATLRRAVTRAPDARRRLEGMLKLLSALSGVPGSGAETGRLESVLLREFADVEAEIAGRGTIPVGLHVLLRQADDREDAGDRSAAIGALRAAAARFGSVRLADGSVGEIASRRIGSLVGSAPEEFRRGFEREALARLEEARGARDAEALERVTREYPGTAAELEARLGLGELSLAHGDFERSWSSLWKAVLDAEGPLAARAWRRIAALAEAVGNLPFARAALGRAAALGGATPSDWPADGGAPFESLRPSPREPAPPAAGPPRDVARLPPMTFAGGDGRMLRLLGDKSGELLFVFDGSDLTSYRPAEKGFTAPEWSRSFRSGREKAQLLADVVVVTGNRALLVVDWKLRILDLATGEDASPPRSLGTAPQAEQDVVYGDGVVLLRGNDRHRGTVWSAVEATRGIPLWSMDLERAYPDPPLVADGEAIWIPASTWANEPIRRHDLLSGHLRSTLRLPNLLPLVDGSRALVHEGILLLPVAETGARGSVTLTAVPLDGGTLSQLRSPSEGTVLRVLLPHPLGPIAVFEPRDGAPRGTMGQVVRVSLQQGRTSLLPLFTLPTNSVLAGIPSPRGAPGEASHALLVVPESGGQIRLALHDLATGQVIWRRGTTRLPFGLGRGVEPPAFVGRDVVALLEEGIDGSPTIWFLSKEDGAPGNHIPLDPARDRSTGSAELRAYGERLLVRTGSRFDLFGAR